MDFVIFIFLFSISMHQFNFIMQNDFLLVFATLRRKEMCLIIWFLGKSWQFSRAKSGYGVQLESDDIKECAQ